MIRFEAFKKRLPTSRLRREVERALYVVKTLLQDRRTK
jgi:hypothetical protein